jgi:hypothetical protein
MCCKFVKLITVTIQINRDQIQSQQLFTLVETLRRNILVVSEVGLLTLNLIAIHLDIHSYNHSYSLYRFTTH